MHTKRALTAAAAISCAGLLGGLTVGSTPAMPVLSPSALVDVAHTRAVTTPPGAPNILLINLDDLRATGYLAAMPNVQRLFEQNGRSYPNNFPVTPLCSPSRSGLFTGRYPHNTGVTGNGLKAEIGALDQSAMFQGYLHASGYRTAMAGKYINTVPLANPPKYWDRWLFMRGGYNNVTYSDNGQVHKIAGYYTDVVGNAVINDLKQFESTDATPWLIYVAPEAPHAPTTPQDKYAQLAVPSRQYPANFNEADVSDKPPAVRSRALLNRTTVDNRRRAQLRTIKSVDDLVGRVFQQMDALNETDNTLAIFTSDNGYMWGEHRILDKRFPYTESITTPLLVRWPNHVAGGTVDNRLVSNVDILPTLLEAAGISPQLKRPLDGLSIFSSQTRAQLLVEYGYTLDSPLAPWAAVRTPTEQYTEWYSSANGAVTSREFYNLTTDPLQLVNLYGDRNPGNDPPLKIWSSRLGALRHCVGQACVVTATSSK